MTASRREPTGVRVPAAGGPVAPAAGGPIPGRCGRPVPTGPASWVTGLPAAAGRRRRRGRGRGRGLGLGLGRRRRAGRTVSRGPRDGLGRDIPVAAPARLRFRAMPPAPAAIRHRALICYPGRRRPARRGSGSGSGGASGSGGGSGGGAGRRRVLRGAAGRRAMPSAAPRSGRGLGGRPRVAEADVIGGTVRGAVRGPAPPRGPLARVAATRRRVSRVPAGRHLAGVPGGRVGVAARSPRLARF